MTGLSWYTANIFLGWPWSFCHTVLLSVIRLSYIVLTSTWLSMRSTYITLHVCGSEQFTILSTWLNNSFVVSLQNVNTRRTTNTFWVETLITLPVETTSRLCSNVEDIFKFNMGYVYWYYIFISFNINMLFLTLEYFCEKYYVPRFFFTFSKISFIWCQISHIA